MLLTISASTISASILELLNPSLYATPEFDGVAKPTPFRSQRFTCAPFVAASRSFDITFAERDHTCTGIRTGKTKSVKPLVSVVQKVLAFGSGVVQIKETSPQ